ncbi:hypothetical protein FQZ97_831240 [compost metagenome]
MVGHAVRGLGRHREDGGVLGFVAVLHVIRRQRALQFVLADAVGVFAGVTQRALVQVAGPAAAHVEHDEAQGPADGGVGAVAGAEGVDAAVHADFAGDRPVDHEQGRGHVRGCLHPVEVEGLVGNGLYARQHHRRVFGLAAGHHHVDGQDFTRKLAPARCDAGFYEVCVPAQPGHDLVDLFPGRRHNRQAVGEAPLVVVLDQVYSGRHHAHGRCLGLHNRTHGNLSSLLSDDVETSIGVRAYL